MAWATTQYFGCAVVPCGGSQWSAVCHYQPGRVHLQSLGFLTLF
ncbi:unnamed protein product [Haemonchus placei]|uniref:SCP domain-containing protein n=1 Tax=Haemonchus placei TaxID=6290 RepID=A0A0N4VUJ4_HAEPC|nr:unnamed protein product [Haemonchus placei]